MATIPQRVLNKLKRESARRLVVFRNPCSAAIIGCGGIMPSHVNGYEICGLARLVAVCDVSPGALAKALDRSPGVRAYRDYKQMLREIKPDVVSVCTWPQHHAEIIAEAAQAGVKGILCEKPLALQKGELDEIVAVCNRHGVKLAGGHQFRFHPNYIRAAEMIRNGRLGRVHTVRARMSGAVANRGPHLLDTVGFLLGNVAAQSVLCECRRDANLFNRGLPEEESADGEIVFKGGIRLEFEMGEGQSNVLSISVEGTNGLLEVSTAGLTENGKFQPTSKAGIRGRQFRQFIEWVKGRRAVYPADGEQSAKTAELVLAAYESSRLGKRVSVPLDNRGDVLSQLYPEEAPHFDRIEPKLPEAETISRATRGQRLAMDGGQRAISGWFTNQSAVGIPEIVGLTKVILSKKLGSTGGKVTRTFEQEFAERYGVAHAVASTSGTAALHVALGAVNPDPCDEVITTPMSDMGTVIPILSCNCVPVFADVDPVTGNLTAETIAKTITPKTKAVIVVHLFGRPAKMDSICKLLSERGIALIEDCAQAHYAEYKGQKVGTFGDFGCFSLQSSKQITCGDGGMTLVNTEKYSERASLFADKGFDRKRSLSTILFLAPNYRMTELQAAVGRCQLRRLPGLIRSRQQSAEQLRQALQDIPQIILPEDTDAKNAWWRFTFGVDERAIGVSTMDFVEALKVEGVKTSKEFPARPLFAHDLISKQQTYGTSRFPFSEVFYEQPMLDNFPGFKEFAGRMIPIGWSSQVKPRHVDSIDAAIRKVVQALVSSRSKSSAAVPVAG